MRKIPALAFTLVCAASLCLAQGINRSALPQLLNFESGANGTAPRGWGGSEGTVFADNKTVHGGHWSARLERDAQSTGGFFTVTLGIPIDFSGNRIELRGSLRSEAVSEFFGLWMREDADSGSVAFDNMQARQLKGTNDWTEYSITLPFQREAKQLYFGVLMAGTGKTWADDLQLLVDGKPIWDAPELVREKTSLDLDTEFNGGSKITLNNLTPIQIQNLAMLGKVWGFAKYHHPAIAVGKRNWDFDLFRVLPAVLAAQDRSTANEAVRKWIEGLGTAGNCTRCATLNESDLYLKPDVAWIDDESALGNPLSKDLQQIYKNRPTGTSQFYVSLNQGVGNPSFDHELNYPSVKLPDPGFQLLALYRLWNIVQYWTPNRDIVGENLDDVLVHFIPRIALAKTPNDYELQMMALIAQIHDTHANLWSSLDVRPPTGECQVPVVARFVENSAVVSGYSQPGAAAATGLQLGDVIERIDGKPVSDLVQQWTPYYADSNDAARLRDIARTITRGACGVALLQVKRGDADLALSPLRVPAKGMDAAAGSTHDLPGDRFRMLSKDVAYIKMSAVRDGDAANYITAANGAKGLIVDIRNYPSAFLVFSLGNLLVNQRTNFVHFTQPDLVNPGAIRWGEMLALNPAQPHYSGKVVILVDEITQSSAEYHAMAFRTAPGAIVIGSMTAGADGNVSPIPLSGGLSTMVSGLGVFYPDKKPTQRVGIVPDIEVKPTIAGIRAGRDEVLEEALRQILGANAPVTQIVADAKQQTQRQ